MNDLKGKTENKWPALPSGMLRPPKGCSAEGRKFTNVDYERVPYLVRALLDDSQDDTLWLKVEFQAGKSGVVSIEVTPFDHRRIIEQGDEAVRMPLYVEELGKRVLSGQRTGPQFMAVNKDGWFSLESDTENTPAFVVPGLNNNAFTIH